MKRTFTLLAFLFTLLAVKAQVVPAGKGTASDPFQITTPDHLIWFSNYVRMNDDGKLLHADACAELKNDIDMIDVADSYTPSYEYSGTFDGNGFAIKHMTKPLSRLIQGGTIRNLFFQNVNISNMFVASWTLGMVAQQADNATISNVHVVSGSICPKISDTNAKAAYMGGLVGYCHNTVKISDCSNNVAFTADTSLPLYCGGIVGKNIDNLTIDRCANYADIRCGDATCGGIVGYGYATVSNCAVICKAHDDFGGIFGCITGASKVSRCLCVSSLDYSDEVSILCKRNYTPSGKTTTVSNCCYVNLGQEGYYQDKTSGSVEFSSCRKFTYDNLRTGIVCYFLNEGLLRSEWMQDLEDGRYAFPVPAYNDKRVYVNGKILCDYSVDGFLSNIKQPDPVILGHDYDNGVCKVCHACQEPDLVGGVYQIGNAGQMYAFFDQMVSGDEYSVKLVNDIDLSPVCYRYSAGVEPLSWGFKKTFKGTFDGNNHTIKNLYFINDLSISTGSNLALFYKTASGTVIKNLTVEGMLENYNNPIVYEGTCYSALVAGQATGTTFANITTKGSVDDASTCVGALVGKATDCNIYGCENYASVNGKEASYTGGLVGHLKASDIYRCENYGTVSGYSTVGGIVAIYEASTNIENYGRMLNLANFGAVSGGGYTGGICGTMDMVSQLNYILNCGNVTSKNSTVGAVIGGFKTIVERTGIYYDCSRQYVSGKNNITTTPQSVAVTPGQLTSGEVAFLLNKGVSGSSVWGQNISVSKPYDSYPTLLSTRAVYQHAYKNCQGALMTSEGLYYYSNSKTNPGKLYNGDGHYIDEETANCKYCSKEYKPSQAADGYYLIASLSDLLWLRNAVKINYSVNARLMTDIDLSSVCGASMNKSFTPIRYRQTNIPYLGTFDGNGHSIIGLYSVDVNANYQGLFGYVGTCIKNLHVEGTVGGKKYVGVLAARVGKAARVEGCTTNGYVGANEGYCGGITGLNEGIINECENSAWVVAPSHVGGIAGVAKNNIECSVNHGEVMASGTETPYAGGIAGYVYGEEAVQIYCCGNTGKVLSADYLGGLVGAANCAVTLDNSWSAGTMSGFESSATHVESLLGYTTDATTAKVINCFRPSGLPESRCKYGKEGNFTNGEVASKLCAPWGQNIDFNANIDAFPVIYGLRVAGYNNIYSNTLRFVNIPVIIANLQKNKKFTKAELDSYIHEVLNR